MSFFTGLLEDLGHGDSQDTYTELEPARLVGLRMLAEVLRTCEVMEALHVYAFTVVRWRRRLRDAGGEPEAAASDAPRCGRPQKLSAMQKAALRSVLLGGAEAAGSFSELCTIPRLLRAVHDRFGIDFHGDPLGQLLYAIGFSPRKPILRRRPRV